MRKPHSSNLAEVTTVTEPESNSVQLSAKGSGISDDDTRTACDVFSVAVQALKEPGKVAAPMLGLSEPALSEMKTAFVPSRCRVSSGQIQRNRAFGVALIRQLAKLVGHVQVTERGRVDKHELRKQLVLSMERNPAILRVVMADAAEKLGVDEEEAASVWDEPTDVDAAK
jgi:hypothetical protein